MFFPTVEKNQTGVVNIFAVKSDVILDVEVVLSKT